MLIILDRDGVINHDSDHYIKSPQEWHPIPGSLEAIVRLNQAGHKVCVVTNQSGVARGLLSEETLNEIHEKMKQLLKNLGGHLDDIYACIHHPDDNCDCRKPQIAFLKELEKRYPDHFKKAFFIGDTIKDMEAAFKIKCRAILVRTGKGKKTLKAHPELVKKVSIYDNLSKAVDKILKK